MTQTNPSVTLPNASMGPVAAPAGPRERRIRFGQLALAIALVVVGALGAAGLVVVVAGEGRYLALARDVAYGAQIQESDLITVQITSPPGLSPVPASEIHRVVGNYAAMPLAKGTLLTSSQVTATRHPGPGEARIGITLRNDRLPGQHLRPGLLLLLVDTSGGDNFSSGDQPVTRTRTWEVILASAGNEEDRFMLGGAGSREVTLDVIVPARDAPLIATLAADGDIAVAVLPGQPGA